MSQPERKQDKKAPNQVKQERLKEIQALYRTQIKQIYNNDNKEGVQKQEIETKKPIESLLPKSPQPRSTNMQSPSRISKGLTHIKSANNLPISQSNIANQEKVRASVYLKGQSTRTIQILRKQNQTKQLKIRELTNRCEALIQKLKKYLQPGELQRQLQRLKEYSEDKVERLENLFKIKNSEIFFKIKLQIIGLLQQFGIGKEQLTDINDVANQTSLFTYMTRKLKGKLKDFRSKQQQSNFQIQKDRILNQKQEERIHFLTQTNQLLRLSQSKLKAKVQDLKVQLNDYLQKKKQIEALSEERQSQIFRLRKQIEQLNLVNQKLSTAVKGVNNQKIDERRTWQAKQREMKSLLNNYSMQKKKLQNQLEEREGQFQQIMIKQRFLEQQNERINRQLIRWKERYEWIQKDKLTKVKQLQDQKHQIQLEFEEYKLDHNQGIQFGFRSDVNEALKKVEQYQNAYQQVLLELQEERRLLQRSQEQAQEKIQKMEKQFLERVKRLEKTKQQQLIDITNDYQVRQVELRSQFQQKQKLLAEEWQARTKNLMAQHNKKATQEAISRQNEIDQLRQEIERQKKSLEAQQSYIAMTKTYHN